MVVDFPDVPLKKPILPKVKSEEYMGRVVLVELEGGEDEDTFSPKHYLVGEIVGYSGLRDLFRVQCYNQSGGKDGSPDYEKADDLWLLPAENELVQVNARPDNIVQVLEYTIAGMTVTLGRPTAAQKRAFKSIKKKKTATAGKPEAAAAAAAATDKKNTSKQSKPATGTKDKKKNHQTIETSHRFQR